MRVAPIGLVALASQAAALAQAQPLTVAVEVDASRPTLTLAGTPQAMLHADLGAQATRDGVRLHLRAFGPRAPTRWIVWIDERDPDGRVVRKLSGSRFTGRGEPPPFVDFTPERPAAGAYVAVLELRALEVDAARSAPVVLPPPGAISGPARPTLIASLPEGAGVEAVLERVERRLLRRGARLRVEGHWDAGADADAASEALARGIARALIEAGVPDARIEVRARGAQAPRYPSLSKAIRRRNRRVELWALPPPALPAPTTRLHPATPRALDLRIDGRAARVPLNSTSSARFTMDLDPPARVQAALHMGSGGFSQIQRSVSARSRGGVPTPVVLAPRGVERSRAQGPRGLALVSGRRFVSEDGPALELELLSDEATRAWSLAVVDGSSGRVVAGEAGEGPPPPRVVLALTSTVTERLELSVAAQVEEDRVEVLGPARVPPLELSPMTTILSGGSPLALGLSELLLTLEQRPEAQLVVEVHGGRRAARREAERRVRSALTARGLSEDRLVWSAGRSDGDLTLSAHLTSEVAVRLP